MERLIGKPPSGDPDWNGDAPDPAVSPAPWQIYNIGGNRTIEVTHSLELLEQAFGRTAIREYLPMQPGDVPETRADAGRPCRSGRHPADDPHRGRRAPLRSPGTGSTTAHLTLLPGSKKFASRQNGGHYGFI